MLKNKKNQILIGLIGLLVVSSTATTIINNNLKKKEESVLAETVTVTARVGGCILDINADMERRYKDNMSTYLTLDIYDEDDETHLGSVTTLTDEDGEAVVDICAEGLTIPDGRYDFQVRGYSHITKKFEDKRIEYDPIGTLDFTESETFEFFAGETSNIWDDKINSLDISTLINNMYSDDYKNDLTQDEKVNSLDVSNTIDNFYMEGDADL